MSPTQSELTERPDRTASPLTADAIVKLLQLRHPHPEWATFPELRCGVGFSRASGQSIDLFAFHTWPSKGFRSVAYEVKITRSDFKREIANPAKRAFAEKSAAECYFATPRGLLRPDEVPLRWGLIEVGRSGAGRVVKVAQQRTPEPWSMSFIASLCRRATVPSDRISKTMWLLAGQELTEEQLVAIADETAERTVASRLDKARLGGRHEVESSEHYKLMEALLYEVRRHVGFDVDATKFRAWAKLHGDGVDRRTMEQLRRLRDDLNELLNKEEAT